MPRIRVASSVVLVFLLAALGSLAGATMNGTQDQKASEDTRKDPGFDPTKFDSGDLTALLKGKKFTDGKHALKTFADGSKLTIETKKGKIAHTFLTNPDGSESEATIHSPSGTPTARSFSLGISIKTPRGERCYICTFGRDQQQSSDAAARDRKRLVTCFRAPCDDFYPEPDPPTIEPLDKKKSGGK